MSIVMFMALAPIQSNFKDEALTSEFANIYAYLQNPTFQIMYSSPTATQLKEGQPVWVFTGGVYSQFTKINGSTVSVALGRN